MLRRRSSPLATLGLTEAKIASMAAAMVVSRLICKLAHLYYYLNHLRDFIACATRVQGSTLLTYRRHPRPWNHPCQHPSGHPQHPHRAAA